MSANEPGLGDIAWIKGLAKEFDCVYLGRTHGEDSFVCHGIRDRYVSCPPCETIHISRIKERLHECREEAWAPEGAQRCDINCLFRDKNNETVVGVKWPTASHGVELTIEYREYANALRYVVEISGGYALSNGGTFLHGRDKSICVDSIRGWSFVEGRWRHASDGTNANRLSDLTVNVPGHPPIKLQEVARSYSFASMQTPTKDTQCTPDFPRLCEFCGTPVYHGLNKVEHKHGGRCGALLRERT